MAAPLSPLSSASAFPLPPELFTQVCAHLSPADLITATHVSRSWRQTLLSTPLLWSELTDVDLTHPRAVERAKALLGRARGGLARFEVGLPMDEERMDEWKEDPRNVELAIHRFRLLLRALLRSHNTPLFRHFTLATESLRDEEDLLFPLLEHLAHFCEYAAPGITHLTITTHMARFPGGQPWFDLLPNLRELVLSTDDDGDHGPDYPDGLQMPPEGEDGGASAGERGEVALERWVLAGGYLQDPTFRSMPHLTSLKLLNTSVPHLSSLLLACAPSLRKLWLVGTDPDPFRPPSHTPLATITLPALRSAYVGCLNSPLWLESQDLERRYVLRTPGLEEVSWGRKAWFDRFAREEGAEYAPSEAFTAELLRKVLKGCPGLRRVDVDGTDEEEGAIAECWAGAGPNLCEVVLGDRATDAAVRQLASSLPQLELLSVEYMAVHFPALANFAWQLYVDKSPLSRTTDSSPVTIRVTNNHYSGTRFGTAHLADGLVRALQRVQLAQPGGDVVADLFAAIRDDIQLERFGPGRFDRLEGYARGVAALLEEAQPLETGVAPPLGGYPVELAEQVRSEGERVLREWLVKRHDELAKEWLEAQEFVRLEWVREDESEGGEEGAGVGDESEEGGSEEEEGEMEDE